jgi:hypothetical protein
LGSETTKCPSLAKEILQMAETFSFKNGYKKNLTESEVFY